MWEEELTACGYGSNGSGNREERNDTEELHLEIEVDVCDLYSKCFG
jgi:hypothetical protein